MDSAPVGAFGLSTRFSTGCFAAEGAKRGMAGERAEGREGRTEGGRRRRARRLLRCDRGRASASARAREDEAAAAGRLETHDRLDGSLRPRRRDEPKPAAAAVLRPARRSRTLDRAAPRDARPRARAPVAARPARGDAPMARAKGRARARRNARAGDRAVVAAAVVALRRPTRTSERRADRAVRAPAVAAPADQRADGFLRARRRSGGVALSAIRRGWEGTRQADGRSMFCEDTNRTRKASVPFGAVVPFVLSLFRSVVAPATTSRRRRAAKQTRHLFAPRDPRNPNASAMRPNTPPPPSERSPRDASPPRVFSPS